MNRSIFYFFLYKQFLKMNIHLLNQPNCEIYGQDLEEKWAKFSQFSHIRLFKISDSRYFSFFRFPSPVKRETEEFKLLAQ